MTVQVEGQPGISRQLQAEASQSHKGFTLSSSACSQPALDRNCLSLLRLVPAVLAPSMFMVAANRGYRYKK